MALTLGNIESSACKITLDGSDMGHTQEGIGYEAGHLFRDRQVDKFGETVADVVQVGDFLRVTCRVSEETFANLQVVYPLGLTASSNKVYLGYSPGRKGSSVTSLLVLTSLLASDTFQLKIFKALVREVAEVSVSVNDDRMWDVTFEALIDETQGEGKQLGSIRVNT